MSSPSSRKDEIGRVPPAQSWPSGLERLAEVELPNFLQRRRWYPAKDAGLPAVTLSALLPFPDCGIPAAVAVWQVTPAAHPPLQLFVPLALIEAEQADPSQVIAGSRRARSRSRPRRHESGRHRAVSRRQCSIVAGPRGSIDANKGIGSTTLEFKISFVWPITPKTGAIKAEGVVDQLSRRSVLWRGGSRTARGACLISPVRTRFLEYCWSQFRAVSLAEYPLAVVHLSCCPNF